MGLRSLTRTFNCRSNLFILLCGKPGYNRITLHHTKELKVIYSLPVYSLLYMHAQRSASNRNGKILNRIWNILSPIRILNNWNLMIISSSLYLARESNKYCSNKLRSPRQIKSHFYSCYFLRNTFPGKERASRIWQMSKNSD